MENVRTYTVSYLAKLTEEFRTHIANLFVPDQNDRRVPGSVLKYKPLTWEETPGMWHTVFGAVPEVGIWTVGTSPFEAMQEFDKELKIRLDKNGCLVHHIEEPLRERLHRTVVDKINQLMGW